MDPSSPATTRFGRFRAALSESPPLLWAFVYFFCLLSGYYVLRPVREAMAASSDVQAVFPPAMIEFFAVRGLALKDFTLQVLFTCTFIIMLLLQPGHKAKVICTHVAQQGQAPPAAARAARRCRRGGRSGRSNRRN